MIQRVEVYQTMGQTFPTAKAAVEYREGLVEEFLRKLPGFQALLSKDRIAFVEAVLKDRRSLINLLAYDVPKEE